MDTENRYLFENGHAPSREKARVLIEEGAVLIDGRPVTKPSANLDESVVHTVELTKRQRFVSRGGALLLVAATSFVICRL